MRILAIDIGAGTQDILLFDSGIALENCAKIIVPSPTVLVARQIEAATRRRLPVLMDGFTMGGGPDRAALVRHLQAGLAAYATEEAALTFHDDLDKVRAMGVGILPQEEVSSRAGQHIHTADVDLGAVKRALESFGAESRFDAVAVAVLDHGFAPRGTSNRLFRFQFLEKLIRENPTLEAFARMAGEIPSFLTRMKAAAGSADIGVPALVMDTGAAAALGSLQDPLVSRSSDVLAVNTGNSHTVAFHLVGLHIRGFFEHHTGLLDAGKLENLVDRLSRGVLQNADVFDDGGHGALVIDRTPSHPLVTVTGPRRSIARGARISFHAAVPHGDMMLTGCYGLVKAFGLKMPGWREEIERSLA